MKRFTAGKVGSKAAALDPKSPHAHMSQGEVLIELGRFAEASAAFRRSLELLPSDVPLHQSVAHAVDRPVVIVGHAHLGYHRLALPAAERHEPQVAGALQGLLNRLVRATELLADLLPLPDGPFGGEDFVQVRFYRPES